MQALSSFLLILLGVTFSMVGDVYLKKSLLQSYGMLTVGIIFYALGAVPVAFAFKKIEFGAVFLIWEAVTVVAALVVASWIFNESFTFYKAIALLLAMGALYFSYK